MSVRGTEVAWPNKPLPPLTHSRRYHNSVSRPETVPGAGKRVAARQLMTRGAKARTLCGADEAARTGSALRSRTLHHLRQQGALVVHIGSESCALVAICRRCAQRMRGSASTPRQARAPGTHGRGTRVWVHTCAGADERAFEINLRAVRNKSVRVRGSPPRGRGRRASMRWGALACMRAGAHCCAPVRDTWRCFAQASQGIPCPYTCRASSLSHAHPAPQLSRA